MARGTGGKGKYITIRALLVPGNALLFDTIFTQGQKVKYTNLQELEESAW